MKSLLVLSLVAALTDAACGQGQPPFSMPASMTQTMGFTHITITWSRPTARGRTLFGPNGVSKPTRVWTPGADSASAIEFDRAVMIDGHQVPAGRYSIWALPDTASWTLIFNKVSRTFHTNYPGEANDVLRVQVKVEQGPHVEALRFDMPEADRNHVLLRISWGETRVSLPIRAIEP